MKQGRIKYSAFPLLLLSGCVSLGEYPSKVELPIQIDAKRFATCMAPLSARLKPGVDDIFRSLTPLSGASLLSKNIKPIFGIDPWFVENQWNILSRIDDLADDFGEGLQVFQKTDGPTLDLSSVFRGEIANAATDLPGDVLKVAERTEAYFLAYNKGMAKIGLPKKIGGAEGLALAKRLSSILETTPETSEQRKALKEIIEDLLGTSTADTASSLTSGGGFVARDGTVYAFPGVLPTNNGGVSIDHNQLGADAIRIILESLRDSYAPLPVAQGATAAWITKQCNGPRPKYCNFRTDKVTELDFSTNAEQRIVWSPDPAHQTGPAAFVMRVNDVEELEANARNAEAVTAAAVGKAIRGGSWGSLNNEAVAKVIETAAGVFARLATERAQWCVKYSSAH